MGSSSALHLAIVLAAVGWPLAAGATLVLASQVRAAERRRRLAALEGGLQGLFRSVSTEPVPARLELVVEALEEQLEMSRRPAPARARQRAARAVRAG